ncbi:MAG TPA: preprotein translocase subunit YajC [Terriglobales bacterium]|nr:preprotein translocase subunit YajC [Terriglobales bacterium]
MSESLAALVIVLVQAKAPGGAAGVGFVLPLILIFGVFYFLLIMPQQRRQKKWQQMLGELKTGDRVVTSGGLRGTIIALRDDYVHLRVPPDNLRVEVARSAVVSVTTGEEAAKTA